VLVLAALSAGCVKVSGGAATGGPTARVSGRVIYQGTPLPAGGVRFTSADGSRSEFTMIRPGGSYSLARAPVGPVKVCGDTAIIRRLQAKPRLVPEKYRTFKDTDLTHTVTPGDQIHDIVLP